MRSVSAIVYPLALGSKILLVPNLMLKVSPLALPLISETSLLPDLTFKVSRSGLPLVLAPRFHLVQARGIVVCPAQPEVK